MDEGPTTTLEARVEWIREVVADGCGLDSDLHRDLCAALAAGDHDSLMNALQQWIALPDFVRLEILHRCHDARDARLPMPRVALLANS
jgi:hypothetical protein